MNAYENLISKLDNFIKKYYKIKIARGVIIFISLFLFSWLLISFSEYRLNFSVTTRTFILYSFILFVLYIFSAFILLPALKLFSIGKRINYKQASNIISNYFPEIKDNLLNILELHSIAENEENNLLIQASIEQKADKIKLIPFASAVKYSALKKYLKYAIPVLLIFGGVLLIAPSDFKESTKHIINYKTEYKEPAPFYFEYTNKNTNIKRGENLTIQLKVKGKYLPEDVFINIGGSNYYMKNKKNSKSEFYYELKNIYNSLEFYFTAQDIKSENFRINVLPAPVLKEYFLMLNPPAYTGEKDTILKNTNEIIVPFGTIVTWKFMPDNIDSLILFSDYKKRISLKKDAENFIFKKRFLANNNYSVSLKNQFFTDTTSLKLKISVIPDLYPSVQVEQQKDSSNFYIRYFKGLITDDYGFEKLYFKFRVVDKDEKESKQEKKYIANLLPFSKTELKQFFYYAFNFSDIKPDDNQKIEYFFEVWDNDGVGGSKKSRTQIFSFEFPSKKERDEFEDAANNNINSKLDRSLQLAEELKKDLQNLRERNLDGNISDWENKQILDNILNKQNLLKKLTDEVARENKEKNKIQEQFNKQNDELLKKQQEIQKLLDEVMTDELKELMKELEKLQEKFNKNMLNKLMKENEFSYKEMSERLDRTKELLKREQAEQKVNKAIDELNKLAEEQEKLSEQTKNKELSKEELMKKQNDISEKFDDALKNYEDAKKINEELKDKMNLTDFEKEKEQIKDEFQNSKENLSKGKKNKASNSQKKNAQNMKKLAESMDLMMSANSMDQQGEDIESLRKILDNLVNFSFKQENLIKSFTKINHSDPKTIQLFDEQVNMQEDFSLIKDSLEALAYRIPQINTVISDQVYSINSNLSTIKSKLEERTVRSIKLARLKQNKVMTSANNLALLLSELLKQMKNSQQSSCSSSGKPQNKGKKQSMSDLKGMQESLKNQMEKMLQQMKDGKGQFNQNVQSKQLAKMLAQQEIFKQMLKEMQSGFSLKPETQRLLNEINKMNDENKENVINRQITPELLERQKKIETRLLEAEKAENKRKFDKKREAEKPNNQIYKSPEEIFKDKKSDILFKEDLYKKNIRLNNFYKKLYDDYSKSINR